MTSELVTSGLEERDASEEALLVSCESSTTSSLVSFMCLGLAFLASSVELRLFFGVISLLLG